MSKKAKRSIVASYDKSGYAILLMPHSEELYHAGNHPSDSVQQLPAGDGLDLRTIRRFAMQTGKDIAEERGIPFHGVEREGEPFDTWERPIQCI